MDNIISKNPTINNFLVKYEKKDWNTVLIKLCLIAIEYLKDESIKKKFYSFDILDEILNNLRNMNYKRPIPDVVNQKANVPILTPQQEKIIHKMNDLKMNLKEPLPQIDNNKPYFPPKNNVKYRNKSPFNSQNKTKKNSYGKYLSKTSPTKFKNNLTTYSNFSENLKESNNNVNMNNVKDNFNEKYLTNNENSNNEYQNLKNVNQNNNNNNIMSLEDNINEIQNNIKSYLSNQNNFNNNNSNNSNLQFQPQQNQINTNSQMQFKNNSNVKNIPIQVEYKLNPQFENSKTRNYDIPFNNILPNKQNIQSNNNNISKDKNIILKNNIVYNN